MKVNVYFAIRFIELVLSFFLSFCLFDVCVAPKYDQRPVVRALYSYLASGENQLTFHEHDRIALVGERANGWQFGENLRTQQFGWFPVAYTEMETDENTHSNWNSVPNGQTMLQNGHMKNSHSQQLQQQQQQQLLQHQMMHQSQSHHLIDQHTPESSLDSTLIEEDEEDDAIPSKMTPYHDEHSPTRMFGDTIMYRQSKQYRRVPSNGNANGNMVVVSNGIPKPGPPPTLPAPIPMATTSAYGQSKLTQSHSFTTNGGVAIGENRKSMPSSMNFSKQVCYFSPVRDGKIKRNVTLTIDCSVL